MTSSSRRPGPSVRVRVREHTGPSERRREDRVATEEPLEVRVAWPGVPARRIWVTMRTPGHDFELAVGYLRHEGVVESGDQVDTVAYCVDKSLRPEQEYNVVTVRLSGPPLRPLAEWQGGYGAGSACGVCGKDSVAAVLQVPHGPVWTGPRPDRALISSFPALMRTRQSLFDRTGGVHAAGLFTAEGEVLVVREDVGRHNAVDKVTGARLLDGLSPAEACLVVSGRAGFELVQKAVAAGTGGLVAVGAPTSLAVELADRAGLSLFGFTTAQRCVQYA